MSDYAIYEQGRHYWIATNVGNLFRINQSDDNIEVCGRVSEIAFGGVRRVLNDIAPNARRLVQTMIESEVK